MFRFYGGVARLLVPDNLKSGVHKASFYDPEINRSYGMMASHYGVGILPARPYRPRDKAKVEAGVRFAQTYILGRLRRQTFFSLAEANQAIGGALERINDHVMRRLGVSRRQLFETLERTALAPLPDTDYEFAEWRFARVSLDYHVELEGFFYSVPHQLIRERNYPPLSFERRVCGLVLAQARMLTITLKGFAALSLAVSMVVRTSASASAAHIAR
jgi:transposase